MVQNQVLTIFLILLAYEHVNQVLSLASFPSTLHHSPLSVPSSSLRSRTVLKSSPLDGFLKSALTGPRRNGVETSIETALILTDKKRQDEWKKDIGKNYPLIPSFLVDVCVDSISSAFSEIAPAQLQAALKPGGLEKVRPELEKGIVETLEKQEVLKGIPLKQDEKRKFLLYVVNMALGYLLRDAELALAKPSVKLQALDAQKREIQRYMTIRQMTWYRIQSYPLQMALLGATSVYVICTLYFATKHTLIVSQLTAIVLSTVSYIGLLIKKITNVLANLIPVKSARKVSRRVKFRR